MCYNYDRPPFKHPFPMLVEQNQATSQQVPNLTLRPLRLAPREQSPHLPPSFARDRQGPVSMCTKRRHGKN